MTLLGTNAMQSSSCKQTRHFKQKHRGARVRGLREVVGRCTRSRLRAASIGYICIRSTSDGATAVGNWAIRVGVSGECFWALRNVIRDLLTDFLAPQ